MTGYEHPTVVVVGAGAMGCVFGGLLAEGGLDVTLIDIWQEHVEAINRDGLRLSGHGGERFIPLRAITDATAVAPPDVVFFQCKATANAAAAESAKPLFANPATVAISFQNGLGNEEEIGAIIGADAMIAGLTAQAAILEGPGKVRNFAALPSYIGEIAGGLSPRVEQLAAAFSRAGLETHASAEIMRQKWSKLLVNTAFAGTSGITGLTLGEVIQHGQLSVVARRAMEEAAAVAAASGVALDAEARRVVFDQIMAGAARNNKASVYADLSAGRRSEVDYIYGSVIRLASRHDVPVPTLGVLFGLIKGREQAMARERASGS
jgi:2-dehydropantoate 2-reductase